MVNLQKNGKKIKLISFAKPLFKYIYIYIYIVNSIVNRESLCKDQRSSSATRKAISDIYDECNWYFSLKQPNLFGCFGLQKLKNVQSCQ